MSQSLQNQPMDAFEEWCRSTFEGLPPQADERVILLLGQTGSGKSAFLNLLCNFPSVIRHGKAAMEGEIHAALDLRFETNVNDRTVSQTKAATQYSLRIGDLRLCIVDTPGFGDTCGTGMDKKHAKMIVDRVKKLQVVHAITLVVCGRDARMTAQLKYVLNEVCAILPKSAKSNIMVVFTNTAGPTYLSFDIGEVNKLVEHQVANERQIYIENPYVMWERVAQNRGKVDEVEVREELLTAFKAAEKNLAKFFREVAKMPKLNTDEFETLYKMRQAIEATTLNILAQFEDVQQQRKHLEKEMQTVQRYKNQQEMSKDYKRSFECKRWVFKDARRHGTFCGYPGCHSNCHAPCKMEKSMDNERFRRCMAFFYTKQQVTLESEKDRRQLLRHVQDTQIPVCTDEDGGMGTRKVTVLRAPCSFCFKDKSFMQGAFIGVPGARTEVQWASAKHLERVALPITVTVADESDQDTCKECGHHRAYHYHDEKIWVEEDYTEERVDEETKKKYEEAKTFHERQQELVTGLQKRIQACEDKQKQMGGELMENVRRFELLGFCRNYCLLLENQRDLLEQHIKATLESDQGADVKAMKQALEQLEKQLQVVRNSLGAKLDADPVGWAYTMMGLGGTARLPQVEKAFKEEALRHHPDHGAVSGERMQQLNAAAGILRKHLSNQATRTTWTRFKSMFK